MAAAAQKTASTHRTAVLRGAHRLDILGYTTRCHLGGADGTVRSRSFDVGGFLWTLVCRFHEKLAQPKGVTLASVSLELYRNETDEAVVASASVRIDDASGNGQWPAAEWRSEEPNVFPARSSTAVAWELAVPEVFRDHEARYVDADADCLTVHCTVDVHRDESIEGATSRSCLVGDGLGWSDFMKVASAKSDCVGYDGSFTIHCRVEVTSESCTSNTVVPATTTVAVLPSNMSWHLEQLLASEEGWDVKFLVEESEIRAHGLVIATRSPALHDLMELATNTDHVRVDGMKASTFKAMIHFIYTDELPRMDDLVVPSDVQGSFMNIAGEMLAAACRFRLERMRRLCENLLAENITAGNALATVDLAGRQGCVELETYCIDYIALPHVVKEVMKTLGSFCRVSRSN